MVALPSDAVVSDAVRNSSDITPKEIVYFAPKKEIPKNGLVKAINKYWQ